MPLTPLDIHNKEFSRSFRGYDEDEVNEFLDQVIKDYEALIRENKDAQNQMMILQERLDHFTNIEESLSKTIIVAQEAADEVKSNSKKEAQLILKEAEKIGLEIGLTRGEDMNRDIESTVRDKELMGVYKMIMTAQ